MPLPADPIQVIVSRKALPCGTDAKVIALLPPEPDRAGGFGPELKPSPDHLMVLPLASAVEEAARGLAQPIRAVVAMDASTPCRMLVEVLFTLGQSNGGVYDLAVQHDGQVTGIEVRHPSRRTLEEAPERSLNLAVLLVRDGISVKGAGGNMGPGCEGIAAGWRFPSPATSTISQA